MSFANPTRLQIGMTGTLDGQRYRIAGRVVLGMEEEGETYYWNEFNLVTAEGESATLVYEVTERGGEWRLFRMFEPQFPLSAGDASTKRVGDPLNLDGTDVSVTLVDESRVYRIEGEAPEGVEVGDVARYFNAEAPGTMIVVSWTGDEVECYRGTDLSAGAVKLAFGVEGALTSQFGGLVGAADGASSSKMWTRLLVLFAVVVVALTALPALRFLRSSPSSKVVKAVAPDPAIALGAAGKLHDKNYRVLAHAVVEIAQVGLRSERHEFQLAAEDDSRAVLVFSSKPGARDWVLFTPVQAQNALTPRQAGAVRVGQTVSLGGYVGPVTTLFQSTVRRVESPEAAETRVGAIRYGFSVQAPPLEVMAEWNQAAIDLYSGETVLAQEVAAAFGAKPSPK